MKYLGEEDLEKYRNALIEAERSIETALQTMSVIELKDGVADLWDDLNHAWALVQTGIRKDYLMRDFGKNSEELGQ